LLNINKNFTKPKKPNLTIKPLNKIENSTEASTCAFNSHEKQGHTGIFTPKPKKIKKQIIKERYSVF
jgi:hypothetical protein